MRKAIAVTTLVMAAAVFMSKRFIDSKFASGEWS
jgi:hypothetical protein